MKESTNILKPTKFPQSNIKRSLMELFNFRFTPVYTRCMVGFWVLNFMFLGFGLHFLYRYYSIYIFYRLSHVFFQLSWSDISTLSFIAQLIPDWKRDWHLFPIAYVLIAYRKYWNKTRHLEERGSYINRKMRYLGLWQTIARYFPVRLQPSEELYKFEATTKINNADKKLYNSFDTSYSDSLFLESSKSSEETSSCVSDEHTPLEKVKYNEERDDGIKEQTVTCRKEVDAEEINNESTFSSELEKHTENVVYDGIATSSGKQEFAKPVHLPTDRNYLVGCHPHGIFSIGAFFNFATESTGIGRIFPNITPYLGILKLHFLGAFYRDYLMSFGIVSVSRSSLRYLLDPAIGKKTGNLVVVIVGGAHEALDSEPGLYCIHLKTRHGFFKMALETGVSLLPAISFGETATYYQIPNRPGSYLRMLQDWLLKKLTFSMPAIFAWGLMPFRSPITTVVGAPLPVKHITQPTHDDINALRQQYIEAMTALFNKYRPIYDPTAGDMYFC